MTPPVLFLLFNRPDLAERVFSEIRKAEPASLYIAVDGPRPTKNGEIDLVLANRAFAERVDWPCEIHTLFREENLGCGRAVSEAIDWFFGEVEAGIILEDDCVPHQSFFTFAGEMLDRYADADEVMMVNGSSYVERDGDGENSYYFSRFDMVWGWASWARAWSCYDFKLDRWPDDPGVGMRMKERSFLTRWHLNRVWKRIKAGEVDTWDYQWEHAIWAAGGVVITPMQNLISNIGFDERATHTSSGDDGRSDRKTGALAIPLSHPEGIDIRSDLDSIYEKTRIMSAPILLKLLWKRLFK